MPKIGDIKVTKGRGHRLMVWCGAEWKGVALENRIKKNRPYDLQTVKPSAIKHKKDLESLPASKIETIVGGADSLTPTELSHNFLISVCNTDTAENYFLLEAGIEGQEKIIIHNVASGLPGKPFIMFSQLSPGPGYSTITSDGASEISTWLFTNGFWWMISGQNDFIIS